MKSLTKILFAAALLLFVNNVFANTLQDRHLSGFNAIQLSSSFDVYITQGATESVKVDAPDDVLGHIVTEVQNGILKIYNKNDNFWNNWSLNHKKIAIYVNAKNMNGIAISGSGNIYFKDGITTNTLKLKISGSGDLIGKLDAKTLEVSVSGSGDVKLMGKADNATVAVSGSGDYSARDLATVGTSVRVSGSGDATINASDKINAAVSGSGDIRYTGSAKSILTSSRGSGDIHKL